MIIGVGTDILSKNRINDILSGDCNVFIAKTFSAKEIEQAEERMIPNNYYATRFAGKEAVFKTFSISGNHINLTEIEILEGKYGAPTVTLTGKMKEIAIEKGINKIYISLSFDTDYIVAYATALSL